MFDMVDAVDPESGPDRPLRPTQEVERLVEALDASHRALGRIQRELLALVDEVDRAEGWRDTGARDMAHWVSMRYDVSHWKACRWIAAARALEDLPRLSEALETGRLGLDKVVELARFGTPEDEARLVAGRCGSADSGTRSSTASGRVG
jgi:hypothetical protein